MTTWEAVSSKIRILMRIGISPSHCGRHTSRFPHGLTDIFELLGLVRISRFLRTGSFLSGQDCI